MNSKRQKRRRALFLDFIKNNPRCSKITDDIDDASVILNMRNPDLSQRIKVFNINKNNDKTNFFREFMDNLWMPGKKLRGKEWTDSPWEDHLNQTAGIMSFSGIFDFLCMSPMLYYLTRGAGLFSIPLSAICGLLVLILSNKAGEFSMNRGKGRNNTANFILFAFFLLAFVKTILSGMSIDLLSRSSEIKNDTADKYLQSEKLFVRSENIIYDDLLSSSKKECKSLLDQQSKLNTSRKKQRELYSDLQLKMYQKPINPKSNDPKYLIDNYLTEYGPCSRVNLINSFKSRNTFNQNKALNIKNNLIDKLSPISSLYIFQRNKFNDIFNGNPLIGSESDLQKYKLIFDKSDINFNIDCVDGLIKCENKVAWNNSGRVINEAWNQFYGRLINKDWENLGLSYLLFFISILLSTTATIMLYATGNDIRNRASRSPLIAGMRDDWLLSINEEEYDDIGDDDINDDDTDDTDDIDDDDIDDLDDDDDKGDPLKI